LLQEKFSSSLDKNISLFEDLYAWGEIFLLLRFSSGGNIYLFEKKKISSSHRNISLLEVGIFVYFRRNFPPLEMEIFLFFKSSGGNICLLEEKFFSSWDRNISFEPPLNIFCSAQLPGGKMGQNRSHKM